MLHCYFTRPYVVSWGVFQAVACGTRLLVNDFAGIDEVFDGKPFFSPVDLDNQEQINASVIECLRVEKESNSVSLPSSLSLSSCIAQWVDLIFSM